MENAVSPRRPVWAAPLALLAGAGIAGVFVSLSFDDETSAQALPGLTYEMERPAANAAMALVVTSVQRDSAADSADISVGDIIAQVDGHAISSPADIKDVVTQGGNRPITLRLRRSGAWVDKSLPAPPSQGTNG